MRLLSGEKLFFWSTNFVGRKCSKGLVRNKFDPAYWYRLSLVTKNIIKVDLMKNSVIIRGMNYYEQRKCAGDELL